MNEWLKIFLKNIKLHLPDTIIFRSIMIVYLVVLVKL